MKPVFILLAPTASGKTSLAIDVAQKLDLEIINADAYQFYKEMNIGTAKPTDQEMSQAPHHLFDICTPDQPFSAHQFAKQARQMINQIHQRNKHPLLVGGAGFYIRALLTPSSELPDGTLDNIENYENAYQKIIEKDPALKKTLHPNDHYRIQRALFLINQSITPSKAWEKEKQQTDPSLNCKIVTIDIPREILYARINQRVSAMFEQGLLDETQQILQKFPNAKKRLEKTIGYQQCLQCIQGELSKDQAIEITQQKTRNYAKRQLTWIRNQYNPRKIPFENAFHALFCYIKDESNPS